MTATATVAEPAAGALFRTRRGLLGLTQTELGERLDVHYTTIANWERDAPPRVAIMAMSWLLYSQPDLKPSVARDYAKRALRA